MPDRLREMSTPINSVPKIPAKFSFPSRVELRNLYPDFESCAVVKPWPNMHSREGVDIQTPESKVGSKNLDLTPPILLYWKLLATFWKVVLKKKQGPWKLDTIAAMQNRQDFETGTL